MTNSNSLHTAIIGDHIFKILLGEKVPPDPLIRGIDTDFSVITFFLAIYIVSVIIYLILKLRSVYKGSSKYLPPSRNKILKLIGVLPVIGILFFGVYILPRALAGFSWESTFVWGPISFVGLVSAIVIGILLSYLAYTVNTVFPNDDKIISAIPKLTVLSVVTGLANAAIIILITSSISIFEPENSDKKAYYILFYFLSALLIYILGRKIVQTKLIHLTFDLIYNIRLDLFNKIFSSSYQNFEKIDRGMIYATLNDDTNVMGNAANIAINLSANLITVLAIFVYLIIISLGTSIITILAIIVISIMYYAVSSKSAILYEQVRKIAGKYLKLLNGMIDGFKELSIHGFTRLSYKRDIENINDQLCNKSASVQISFVNSFLFGETLLISILALIVFAFPRIFPNLTTDVILSYVIVMLYLIGPVNVILGSIPTIVQIKVSWNRIQEFRKKIPATINLNKLSQHSFVITDKLESLTVTGLKYQYEAKSDNQTFEIGPIDFKARGGEVVFITGGNGSGKTTLVKLLTGLYSASQGEIKINGKLVKSNRLGEYYSAVFNPFYLFKKLYYATGMENQEAIKSYLNILGLSNKVNIKNDKFSTIDLSQGQRKRLALLQCYLENKPIYLFDEWAADQDPDYRRFFYRTLIPEMKNKGKLVIAISHDEHYFGEADQIIRLKYGQQEIITLNERAIN